MAKVQKTFLFPEEVAALVDKAIELGGSNFTKIATAALLQYFFQWSAWPKRHTSLVGVDWVWTRIVVLIERGELTVSGVPQQLIKEAIESKKTMIRLIEEDENRKETPEMLAEMKADLKDFEAKLESFQLDIKEYGGELPAIFEHIGRCFVRK